MSALHLAIKNNSIEIISLLLGQTELDINIELIEIYSIISISLLALGFIRLVKDKSPLIDSMYDTKIPLDKPIAEAFKKRTEKTALYYAIEHENFELLLSQKGLDVNNKSLEESYFKIAFSESEQLVIQEKASEIDDIKKKATSKPKEETSLHLAIQKAIQKPFLLFLRIKTLI